MAVALAAGSAVGITGTGVALGTIPLAVRCLAGLLLWLATVRAANRGGFRRLIVVLAAGAALGTAFGGSAAQPAELTRIEDLNGSTEVHRWVRGRVVREPLATPSGSRFVLDVGAVRLEDGWRDLPGRAEIHVGSEPPSPNLYRGTAVEAFVRLRGDRPPANPGSVGRDRLRVRGLDMRGTVKTYAQLRVRAPPGPERAAGVLRDMLRATIEALFTERDLVRALLLGERDGVADRVRRDMERSGLIHLLAISGLHVGLLVAATRISVRTLGGSGRIADVAAIAVCIVLVAVVEPRAPVQRAAVMMLMFLATRLLGAGTRGLDTLSASVVLLVTIDPIAVADVGFQLTVAATAGLVVGLERFPDSTLLGLAASSTIAQIAVAPLVALTTARLAPLAVAWNLAAVPLVALAMPAAGLAIVAHGFGTAVPGGPENVLTWFARQLGFLADILLLGVRTLATEAATAPGLVVPMGSASLAAVYWFGASGALSSRLHPQLRLAGFGLATGAALLSLRAPASPVPLLTAFDVGQGDAIALVGSGATALYDTGGYPGIDYDVGHHIVAPALRRRGIREIDFLAISHYHADHAAGAPGVLSSFDVGELWIASAPPGSPLAKRIGVAAGNAGVPIQTVAATRFSRTRQRIGCNFRPLLPRLRTRLAGTKRVENGASLGLDVRCAGRRIVLAGDADPAAERDWISAGLASSRLPTILKIGHHGSDTATSDELLDVLEPRHAVISVGAHNPWGLPRDSVVDRLRRRGISVYRTDRDGAVTVYLGRRIRVSGERWIVPRY